MINPLYLPIDELTGKSIDFDRASDYLELTAFFAEDSMALVSDLQTSICSDDHGKLDEEMESGEEDLVSGTVACIKNRLEVLGSSAYPFTLDKRGKALTCTLKPADEQVSFGRAAYILSVVLSNLPPMSPVFDGSCLHPDNNEVRQLRMLFQYFATAALASELQGSAWSFGFPRPDQSGFIKKLTQIWERLGDGQVFPQPGAPTKPKDDQIDVFAARPHPDGLPGFLLAVAQVVTGKNANQKSLKGHLDAFKDRWFSRRPVTAFLPYMIVPFAKTDDQFLDTVRIMGNVLHRLRVPRRVAEAAKLVEAGEMIEGYDQLTQAVEWIASYQKRGRKLT